MNLILLVAITVASVVAGALFVKYFSSVPQQKKKQVEEEKSTRSEEEQSKSNKKQELKKEESSKPLKKKVETDIPKTDALVTVLKGGQDAQNAGPVIYTDSSDKYIATVRESDHYVRLWKTDSALVNDKKCLLVSCGKSSDYATTCALSPDSKYLAFSLDYENTVVIYDLSDEKKLKKVSSDNIKKEKNAIKHMKFSSDGKFIVTSGDKSDEIIFWKVPTGEIVHRFSAGTLQVSMIDLKHLNDPADPSKHLLSCASFTTALKLYSIRVVGDSGNINRESSELKGHSKALVCLTFNPDTRDVATISQDKTLKVFNTLSEKERIELHRTSKSKATTNEIILIDQPISQILSTHPGLQDQDQLAWIKYLRSDTIVALCSDRRNLIVLKVDLKSKKVKVTNVVEATLTDQTINCIGTWGQYLLTGDSLGLTRVWKL